jgi:outer membrane lipoprotein-sorting protein
MTQYAIFFAALFALLIVSAIGFARSVTAAARSRQQFQRVENKLAQMSSLSAKMAQRLSDGARLGS